MQWLSLLSFVAAAAALSAGPVRAQGELTLYCSPQIEWCEAMKTAFEKETGITVSMTRKSSGETYAQVKAEASNPKGDIWRGGTGDPHLQAAEEGLTEEYKSAMLDQLHDWARSRRSNPASRRSACMPARSASATTPSCWRRKACPSRNAGPT
jgi:iron(III) transport system substrate-binding protein